MDETPQNENDPNLWTINQHSFQLCYQAGYENFQWLGEGAYGIVVKTNRKNSPEDFYAIKKISSFDHQTYCQRTLREIKILLKFNHENIIDVKDIVRAEQTSSDLMKEIFLIQECIWVGVISEAIQVFIIPGF